MREGNSPSWFNPVEAVQVIRYAQDLRKFSKHPVNLDDIGIITPYRKQVRKNQIHMRSYILFISCVALSFRLP